MNVKNEKVARELLAEQDITMDVIGNGEEGAFSYFAHPKITITKIKRMK